MRFSILARAASILAFVPALARALPAASPETYGISSDIVIAVHAGGFHFVPTDPPSTEAAITQNGMRSCASGECIWASSLELPSGAVILSTEVSACDGNAGLEVGWGVFAQLKPDGAFEEILEASGTGVTPGCQTFTQALPVPAVVDNSNRSYLILVGFPPGANLGFLSFRVTYRLQVSPAPAIATFPLDVPTTHPFFRFVEALAGAGITAGCGVDQFCPDAPLTRGQMAVFLSVALGLHFPN